MLWDPKTHEPPAAEWDEDAARAAIRTIAADTEDAFDGGWRIHPRDRDPGDHEVWGGTYLGGAGIIDALRRLADRGLVELRRDYLPYLEQVAPDAPGAGLMLGETGILLVRHRLAPSDEIRERVRELVRANENAEELELLWGSPGTMLAARELGLHEEWQASADRLLALREPDTGLWEQHLYGKLGRHIGAGHGFAGCVLALGAFDGAAETARRYAIVEDGLANWPPMADGQLSRNGRIRTQWCHGAPGMITSLGDVLDEDLALAGAELTWQAGPMTKKHGLCHGTAGNGYALLELFQRTQDERWLERARAFAAHALRQADELRAEHGTGWHGLWTGDVGAALFAADCLAGEGRLPLP